METGVREGGEGGTTTVRFSAFLSEHAAMLGGCAGPTGAFVVLAGVAAAYWKSPAAAVVVHVLLPLHAPQDSQSAAWRSDDSSAAMWANTRP